MSSELAVGLALGVVISIGFSSDSVEQYTNEIETYEVETDTGYTCH